jgi:hypothetical protein
MTQRKRIAAYLLTFATAATLIAGRAESGNDQPPPVPYGTQQAMKLRSLIESAPFMAASEDEVQKLMKERLRVCVSLFEAQAERVDLGRVPLEALAQPLADVKHAWLSLSKGPEQQMPILKFLLQMAEHREKAAEALARQTNFFESIQAKHDRLTAEIELAQCQRTLSSERSVTLPSSER